ncbi:LysM peptidoglycan-binding domain-containing protein [Nocardioides sp. WS12]|uniref:LysM peptidoglycan-binding domain-containing protein n=1 Tax=Nocardioides sp. WS12 TaxID=2486272 RepID=UPI00191DFEA0|nr:LysM peptidoglycan-binding domain-containing protein [Nocardioides sp. WS12]
MKQTLSHARIRVRGALLWTAVTATAVTLGRLALTEACALATAPGPDFASLLVQLCSVVALVALAVLWCLTTDVVRHALRPGTSTQPPPRRVGPLRGLLLAACGVAAFSTTTTAAAFGHEGPDAPLGTEALDGLPLPDRATGGGPAEAPADALVVRVRPGDSLWTIAARELGPGASAAQVTSYWHRIHAANADVIGSDPDLLLPDQQLHLPAR